MRIITIKVDDTGVTEVEICCDSKIHQFFTKRDFDRALRAAKLQYRLQKREYRREQIIKQANVTIVVGENYESKKRSERRPEPEPVKREGKTLRSAAPSLSDALRAKTERNRREQIGKAS